MSTTHYTTIRSILILHIVFSTYSVIVDKDPSNSKSNPKNYFAGHGGGDGVQSMVFWSSTVVDGIIVISEYQSLRGDNFDSYNNAVILSKIEHTSNNSNFLPISKLKIQQEQNITEEQPPLPPPPAQPPRSQNQTQKKFLVFGDHWTSVKYITRAELISDFNNPSSTKSVINVNNTTTTTTVNGSTMSSTIVTSSSSSSINEGNITRNVTNTTINISLSTINSTNNAWVNSSSTNTIIAQPTSNITTPQKTNLNTTNTSTNTTSQTSNNHTNVSITNDLQTHDIILSDPTNIVASIIELQPPYKPRPLINTEYKNLGFYHQLPTQYTEGQVFLFWGQITSQQKFSYPISVILMFLEKNTTKQFQCLQEDVYGREFNISCKMGKPGSYLIYIFVGNSVQASMVVRQIKNQVTLKNDAPVNTPEPKGLRLDIINNSLYVSWQSKANITNLTIYQEDIGGLRKRQYILTNNHDNFKVPFVDFESFLPINTFLQISHAIYINGSFSKFGAKKLTLNFQALQHGFSIKQNQRLDIDLIAWRFQVGKEIPTNITFKKQIQCSIFVTEPELIISRLIFINQNATDTKNRSYFKAGSIFPIILLFKRPGVHFLTIYSENGLAILNLPIYVGGYPLIPDFKDLSPKLMDASKLNQSYQHIYQNYYSKRVQKLNIKQPPRNSKIQQKRNYLLLLINGFRKKNKLKLFIIDEQLNKIAQNHTDDMILRNFIGDVSPSGQNLKNRVQKFNFVRSISQTIIKSTYLTQSYLQIQRSATDLQNILNKISMVIGIGINITSDNKYLITYLFSTQNYKKYVITPQQLQQIKQQLIDIIQQKNPNIQGQNKLISEDIKIWMQSNRTQIIFKYINEKRGFKTISGFASKTTFDENWSDKFRNDNKLNGFTKASYVSIGIAPIKQENTIYEIYVLFS